MKKNSPSARAIYMNSNGIGVKYEDCGQVKVAQVSAFWNNFILEQENLEYEEQINRRLM